ncbi:MAG: hypothetical protein ACOCRK_02680 [bacterium]
MKKIRTILIAVLLLSSLLSLKIKAAEDIDKDKSLITFYEEVIENGYINCYMDLYENKDKTYTFKLIYEENILGVNLGFYSTPYITKSFDAMGIPYDVVFSDTHSYLTVNTTFNNLEATTIRISAIPFLNIFGTNGNMIGEFKGDAWNDIREKNEIIDDIYKTNFIVFRYHPLEYLKSNSDKYENGTYIWYMYDKFNTPIVLEPKVKVSGGGLIIKIVAGAISFIILIILIIRLINKRKKKWLYDKVN